MIIKHKMIHYILLLFIIDLHKISAKIESQSAGNTTDCDVLLNDFSVAVSNFTYCALVHAKPITMCANCADSYFSIVESHTQLTKTIVNNTICIDNFINLDRLQIVNSVYNNANDLWNRAKCYECISYINGTHEPTKVRRSFDRLYAKFYDCTQRFNNDSTNATNYCDMCIDDYNILNKFYFKIGDITHGIDGICMDIVDLMNKTQAYWSTTCCQYRVKNEFIYIVTTVFMSMIPILFYVLVKLFVDEKRPRLLPQNRFAESMNTPSTSFRRESM